MNRHNQTIEEDRTTILEVLKMTKEDRTHFMHSTFITKRNTIIKLDIESLLPLTIDEEKYRKNIVHNIKKLFESAGMELNTEFYTIIEQNIEQEKKLLEMSFKAALNEAVEKFSSQIIDVSEEDRKFLFDLIEATPKTEIILEKGMNASLLTVSQAFAQYSKESGNINISLDAGDLLISYLEHKKENLIKNNAINLQNKNQITESELQEQQEIFQKEILDIDNDIMTVKGGCIIGSAIHEYIHKFDNNNAAIQKLCADFAENPEALNSIMAYGQIIATKLERYEAQLMHSINAEKIILAMEIIPNMYDALRKEEIHNTMMPRYFDGNDQLLKYRIQNVLSTKAPTANSIEYINDFFLKYYSEYKKNEVPIPQPFLEALVTIRNAYIDVAREIMAQNSVGKIDALVMEQEHNQSQNIDQGDAQDEKSNNKSAGSTEGKWVDRIRNNDNDKYIGNIDK